MGSPATSGAAVERHAKVSNKQLRVIPAWIDSRLILFSFDIILPCPGFLAPLQAHNRPACFVEAIPEQIAPCFDGIKDFMDYE
jgi:hypothetical protein